MSHCAASSILAQSVTQTPPSSSQRQPTVPLQAGSSANMLQSGTVPSVTSPVSVSPVDVGTSLVDALASVVEPVDVEADGGGVSSPQAGANEVTVTSAGTI